MSSDYDLRLTKRGVAFPLDQAEGGELDDLVNHENDDWRDEAFHEPHIGVLLVFLGNGQLRDDHEGDDD